MDILGHGALSQSPGAHTTCKLLRTLGLEVVRQRVLTT
jgi:hypothetical protein